MKNRRYSESLVIAATQNIKERDYWLNKLSGELVKSSFPYDSLKEVGELPVDSLEFRLPDKLYKRLMQLSKGSHHTLHLLMVTVLVLLLNKYSYSGNNDIIVGVPIEKQTVDNEFVNTVLLLRNRLKDDMTVRQLILEVRQAIAEAIENYSYPVEVLYEQLELSGLAVNGDEDPLVGVGILLENIHNKVYLQRIAPDVTFLFSKEENSMRGRVEYRRHLYEKTTLQQVIDHFSHLMGEALFNVDTEIKNISILSPEERKQVLDEFNHSGKRYSRSPTVVELFASQVNRTPDKIALVHENSWLTYNELNSRSDYLACLIRTKGVSPGSIIGLMVNPSFLLMVGIIGVLKAGGAYLPLAPDWPGARVKFMMSDSKAMLLLSEVGEMSELNGGIEVVKLNDVNEGFPTHLTHSTHPTHLCYIIYTSGSTGRPKGVPITHGNLTPLLLWSRDYFGFGEHTRVLQNLSYTFDFGAFELLTTLIFGGALYFFDKSKMTSTSEYVDFIHLHEINTLHTTPSFLSSILIPGQHMHTLRILHLGGERLTGKLVRDVSQQLSAECRIYNGYGPTETTINSSIFETGVCMESRYDYPMKIMDNTPIGIPSADNIIFIMDTHMNLLPVGVPGELYIGGGGVAPGYLNRPELTAEKFDHDLWDFQDKKNYQKFLRGSRGQFFQKEPPGRRRQKLYKTGDLGCWLVDGNIEFLGRIDHQVKIRGLRVELEEIERRLLTYQDIKDVLVICRDDYLCAYIVPGDEISIGELRGYLSEELPDYMVPSYFVSLERMPLTASGKVDRNALPDPKTGVSGVEYMPPVGFFEEQLVGIWAELLGIEKNQISVHGDFFELGGHSLLATSMAARVHKHFNVKVPLGQILETPTLSELAEYIKVSALKDRYFSIQPVEEKDYYVLSPAQKRMYILQQMELESTGYNMPVIEVPEGDIDKEKLKETFRKIIERHESLRTSFHMVEEAPIQRVHNPDEVKFAIQYYENIESFVRPFDLSYAPLVRIGLLKLEEQDHILIVDMHHIISDGQSMRLIVEDFIALYQGKELPRLRLQYKDYAEWQNRESQKSLLKQQEAYWLNAFAEEIPVLDLPYDYPRPAVRRFEGDVVHFEFGKSEIQSLKDLARSHDFTLYMVLLAIYYVLISKLSGQQDIVVGIPVGGRRHTDLETIIGMFVNTLALRNDVIPAKTFADFLDGVGERALSSFENQEYPFEDLVEELSVERDTSRNPIFDVMFNWHTLEKKSKPSRQTGINNEVFNKSKFDMTLMGIEGSETVVFTFEYCTKLFKKGTIERFIGYFKRIVTAVIGDPLREISGIHIISEEEKDKILYDFNKTDAEYPETKTIHELFREQAARTPDRTAVFSVERRAESAAPLQITYHELNKKTNQMAAVLNERGVGSNQDNIVGIMTKPSLEMVTGILGILKAGGAYLPIDPDCPRERIDYMLKDSKARILLAASADQVRVEVKEDSNESIEMIDISGELSSSTLTSTSTCQISSANLAYIIYTSGSTGKPKGVMVNHGSVVNLLFYLNNRYPFEETDTYLLKTSYIFDVSVTELFGWFSGEGGRLAILPPGGEKDPETIIEIVEGCTVTHINFVPSMFRAFVDILDEENIGSLSSLKYIFLAGEALPGEIINKFRELNAGIRLENIYGPTEATVYASKYSLSDWDGVSVVPIGKPVQNTELYILDKHDNWLPVGIAGELCITGKSLARGYLNRPELTKEKFFRTYISKKLYKTGDLARWLPDGNIEFLGRLDHQVKVRGFRIELGEIEARLLKHEKIKEAVVVTRRDDVNNTYLCAYVVPGSISIKIEPEMERETLNIPGLREYLSRELPDYMVPSYFVQLEEIPLTPSGKTNRNALPEPGAGAAAMGYAAAEGFVEEKLVEIWWKILKIDKNSISVDGNFFELGGHSLSAISMVAVIHKTLDVKVPLIRVLKNPTIRQLARYIKVAEKERYASIEPVEEKDYYVLSPAQKRMYILQQMDLESTGYNMPVLEFLEGDIDKEKLKETFRKIIERHESLRTSFYMMEEAPIQRVHDPDEVEFAIHYHENIESFVRPFDLSYAPLVRIGLLKLVEQDHILMVDMHHIISDGISMDLIVEDFIALSQGKELPPLRLQYKDYAEWQSLVSQKELLNQQENFWLNVFPGEIPVLDLPYDYPRPAMKRFEGDVVHFEFGKSETQSLKDLARSHDFTLYMVLLAIYYVLLSKLSGQQDIAVGIPVGGRRHTDLETIIGMFVNTLALRNDVIPGKTFADLLDEVGERALSAFENQEYPFEDLVEELSVERDTSRNPIFDVMFNWHTLEKKSKPSRQTGINNEVFNKSKFDMTLMGVEGSETTTISIEYCTKLFKKETIERFIGYFKRIVTVVIGDPLREISGIDIISEEEKDKILYDFNKVDAEYPTDKTIHQLFEEQVARTPDHTAVIGGGWHSQSIKNRRAESVFQLQITYNELNRKSNQLARLLREKGIQTNTIVSLMVERSLEMIVGLYAILKAGAAYLPVEPDYPEGRIRYMLEDSGSRFLLTREKYAGNIKFDVDAEIFYLEDETLYKGKTGNFQGISTPKDLLYMIYTSGSTGKPKGVMVKIQGFVNLLYWYVTEFDIDSRDCVLLIAPISFDLAQKNLYASLIKGGTLCLASPGLPDYHELSGTIAREQVTIINSAPSVFYPLIEINSADNYFRLNSMRYLFLGGEPIQGDKLAQWLNGETCQCELVNTYGPTECTDIVSSFRVIKKDIGKQKNIPIGGPIYNVSLFVLDNYRQVVPIGVIGELCIGGIGLSKGYHKNPELTAAKFIQTPHLPVKEVYRTGDLVRWLPDGNILFFGRIDHQVKVRGFRIELGEIEAQLLKHEKIKEAVVVASKDDVNNTYLSAYIVPDSISVKIEPERERETLDIPELREYLAGELPDYMVPSYFVQLEELPLTPSGKTDRKALPEPEAGVVGLEYTAPVNVEEKNLVGMWSKILRIEENFISVNANFFELGGHSLLAVSMIAVIHKKLDVKVPMRQVLKNPTIRQLARFVKRAEKESYASIEPVEEKEYYELSYAQRRLWVLCQFEEDSTAYNMPSAIIVSGRLDIEAFRSAVRVLAERHESLRTVFPLVNGEPKQRIIKSFQMNVEVVDLRVCEELERGERAKEIFRENAARAFDLEHGPLLLIKLVRLRDEDYLLIFNIHHIINDGWSQGIIESEFIRLYNHFLRGEGNPFTPLLLQYKDYTLWHNELVRGDGSEAIEGYWLEKFKDRPNGIELPLDHPRRPVQTFNGRRVHFVIDGETTLQLRRLCFGQAGSDDDNATLFMLLLTLVDILLYKYSCQRDIIVGSPIVGRRQNELHPLVGFLVNTLVYRTDVAPEESFRSLLNKVRQETLTCYENQDYPFDMLVDRLELDRDLSQSPLFNVMLAHNNTDTDAREIDLAMDDVEISPYPFADDVNMSKFDLLFFMDEMGDQVYVRLEYNSDLFEEGTVERMSDNFLALTRSVIDNPEQPIWGLSYIDPLEYQAILQGFNDNEEEFPSLTVQELFEQQAAKTPDNIAVIGDAAHITYFELNRESNQLAHYLREEFSVTPGDVIGISMDRSLEMIIALLGIMKSGAVYMALDPSYPAKRISYMLEDSHTKLVIVDQYRPELLSGYNGNVLHIRSVWDAIDWQFPENPEVINRLSDVLYVTYTSGSTGVPNGAMVSHHILTNLIQWQKEETTVDGSLRCLQFASINFDVSFQEIMSTLTSGGELVLIGEMERKDMDYLMDFLCIHGIQVLYLPFYYLNFLFTEGRWGESIGHCLKHIVTAGEQLIMTPGLKRFLELSPEVQLHNHYGPAEMHVVTFYTLDASTVGDRKLPPIGKPISNVGIYILDDHEQAVPVGVWGEICIGGPPGFVGYANKPDLTARKLLINSPVCGDDRGLYRTGDIGRWLADGNIELKGRKDFQVKIRGFRVEPGEIESKILSVDNIRECVVVVREDASHQNYLAAYMVVKGEIEVGGVRQMLSRDLPQYMVPRLVVLERLPLLPNGKVDRKRLPEPGFHAEQEYTAPRNEIETRLVEIWSDLLGIEPGTISIHSNFFELGGHSLRATIMVSKIHKIFYVKVPLMEVFKQPTIRELARYIKGAEIKERFSAIEPVEKKEYYVLSPAQKRMYILQQMDLSSTAYNIVGIEFLESNVDKEHLEIIFKKLIYRHESLRTSFQMVEQQPVQRIHNKNSVEFEIEYHAGIIKNFVRPFDLSKAPLLRVGLVKQGKNRELLIVDVHHIICDGVSSQIILDDFTALYEKKELSGLHLQYRDYAEWQDRSQQKNYVKKQEAYWLQQFENGISVLELPYDYERPTVHRIEGDEVSIELDESGTNGLRNLARSHGATLFMVLLGVFYVVLAKLSGQEEIVVGIPSAGRRHADLEPIVGMFVNTLPIMNYPAPAKPFNIFLEELKEITLAAFENQDYPFEDMVERLPVPRDISRHPLFDVMFNLQNQNQPSQPPDSVYSPSDSNIFNLDADLSMSSDYHKTAKFDMTLTAAEVGDRLLLRVRYSTNLFKIETIQRFIGYFEKIITAIRDDSQQKLFQIDILSQFEKKRLLDDFNRTTVEYPGEKTIHQIFEEQVTKRIEGIAVTAQIVGAQHAVPFSMSHISITYDELNRRSNQLAYLLRKKGIKPDTAVGIVVEPSVEMVIGIMSILKAGGAYLPIDPEYPSERINYMLKDSNTRILLAASASQVKVKAEVKEDSFEPIEIIDISNRLSSSTSTSTLTLSQNSPINLAYVIYTSGTTGKPKGVLVQHNNLVNYVTWFSGVVELTASDRAILASSFAFDLGYTVFFPPLLNGGELHLLPKKSYLFAGNLLRYIQANRISYIKVAPSFFTTIVRDPAFSPGTCRTLRLIVLGGESIKVLDVEEAHARCSHIRIMNHYGPSETTIGSAACFIDFTRLKDYLQKPTIGYPVNNTRVYILGKHLELIPIGVPGELCISGEGAARGYLERPELTAKKFTVNPYVDGERLYRTGDLARRLENGQLEFLARIDQQVKIRGYRIELGEIERRLMNADTAIIKEAVVIDFDRESKGEKYLCAYLVSPQKVKIPELKEALSKQIPDYMIPSYFLQVEEIPRTPNGKINKKALPVPQLNVNVDETIVTPTSETERILVDLWSEVLDLEQQIIGIDSNFFDLGGHSLKATVLVSKIHKLFDLQVPLVEIFKRPTIRNLASYISLRGVTQNQIIHPDPVEKKEYYALSSAHQRIYRFQQMNPGSTEFNLLRVEPFDKDISINKKKLEFIFKELIRRHEGLRTSFEVVDGTPVQRVHDRDLIEVKVEVNTHSHYSPHAAKDIIQNFVRPFDLSQTPLLRVGLIYIEESSGSNQILLVDMHHIISDAMSMNILMDDFRAFLGYGRVKRTDLPELRIQYKDYSEWHNSEQQKESIKKQELYWLTEFSRDLPVLNLPADYDSDHDFDNEKQINYSFVGDKVTIDIENEKIVFLRQLTAQQDTTMFMVLLAIFYVLLSKISGQEDIVVGVPIDCRGHPALEKILGLFANILALRAQPSKGKNFNLFLEEVKAKSLKAFNNREYPIEDLVEKVSRTTDSKYNCNPLFKVMYNFTTIQHHQHLPERDTFKGKGMADILFTGVETGEDLNIVVEYNAKRFNKETIEKMLDDYLQIISALKKTRGNIKSKDIELESNLLTLEEVSLDVAFNI